MFSMSLTIQSLPVHTANFSGCWRNDVLNYGKIKLSPRDIEEYEEGKLGLKESRKVEIGEIFNQLKTVYIPDTLSLFKSEDLNKAIEKAKQIIYRTLLQLTDHFNSAFPEHFSLGEDKILIPTFTDFQNRTSGIGIHTEGGRCVKKIQALTYMPSQINGELTLYNLFNPNQGKCDNRNLKTIEPRLESITLKDLNSNNLPAVFMIDGESGTAHSASVPHHRLEMSERIIWTIIVNKIESLRLAKLIPDFKKWLEEDISRFSRGEKREENEITSTIAGYTL